MELIRIIEKNKRFILQLVRDKSGKEKLLKVYAEDHPSLDSQAQLNNEWQVAQNLDHPGIRKVRGQVFYDNRNCLELEYIEGENLQKRSPLDLGGFFRFAIELAHTIQYLHQSGYIHRDLSAYNIMFNAVTNHYQIIDLGTSVQSDHPFKPGAIVGTPAYSAPELTGRLNLVPDQRADLYSLGVVYYEMLTGANPYRENSEMQTIYRQIAWMPENPDQIISAIPLTISRIIMKLLQKDPDHRYHSAKGLIYDLEEAQLLFRRNVVPTDFEPGSSEQPPPYNDTPELVNYHRQIQQINQQFNDLMAGRSQLSWLTGEKGMGKSTLIDHFLPEFYEQQVMYLKIGNVPGSTKPFALLFELFEEILKRIDEEPEEQILKRKIRFSAENISDVSFLVEKIPSLSKFVTASENKETHGSIQSQNKFQLALQDLLRVFAIPERPIIAHFTQSDDIDEESSKFFSGFVEDVRDEFIWIILEHSVEQSSGHHHIHLDGLSKEDMHSLFKNMVIGEIRGEEKILPYIDTFAGGNPGRLVELVRYWYQHRFFEFDQKRKYWFWHNPSSVSLYPEAVISGTQIENPVEKDVLEWASLIEGHFSLDMLAKLSKYEIGPLNEALQSLNIKNLVISVRNGGSSEYYKLSASLDPDVIFPDPEMIAQRHVTIAEEMKSDGSDIYRRAFHINQSLERGNLHFSGEQAMLINFEAGIKAKEEGAFHLARQYFERSLKQLEHYEHTDIAQLYTLYLNYAELASLEGSHKESKEMFLKALENASEPIEEAKVYASQVMLHNYIGNHEAALESGFKALDTLGLSVPRKGNRFLMIQKLAGLWFRLNRKDPMSLLELPDMTDKKVILSLRILENLHTSIFNKDSELLLIVLIISMNRILKYGNAPEGYSAYAGFGAVLALGFGNYKKGWAFTLAGAEMANKFNNKLYMGRGLFSKGAWMINYIKHSRESIPILEEGIRLSKESGDFSYATNGYMNLQEAHFMIATPLETMNEKMDEIIAFTFQIGYDDILALSLTSKLYSLRLMGRENEFDNVLEKWFKKRDLDKYTDGSAFKHVRIYYLLLDAYWRYFKGEYEKGLEDLELSTPHLHTLQGPAIIVDYFVIRGLLNYEYFMKTGDKKSLGTFKKSLKKLKKYAKLVPENYEHRYLLLKSLDQQQKGAFFDARRTMRDAVASARENDFLQIEGICSSYLARWFMKIGQKAYARLHFREAMNVWTKWQASYLAETLNDEFAQFVSLPSQSYQGSSSSSSMHSGHSGFSNPEVLMQSALSVSAETDLESLLDVMNRIFIEQAGATKSLLIIRSGKKLSLLYAVEHGEKAYHPFPGKPINEVKNLPLSIIRLVQRSHEPVVIDDSSQDRRFRFEPYLRESEGFSILVTPLIYRGDLSGIIYFENRLLTNAFSTNRQELIQLLSGQFAVALQNAQLVEELEHRVRERTIALESEKDRADHLLKNILPVETAEELKIKGRATSRFHEQVTVMFTDFIGFTKTSEKLHPEVLVKMLDYYFRAFDRIIIKYGLEKIKTIGDAYLCVAGLPVYQPRHAVKAMQAAFEIMNFVNNQQSKEQFGLEIRIGIHSGPVVAGVVGEEKFAFDIWGDTVNTASRMETNSQSGKINISKETMELVSESGKYEFMYRGKIKAKNKGEIDMYFVEENQDSTMDHEGAIAMIMDKMQRTLSSDLHYHSIAHTREILENVEMIGKAEQLNEEEMQLLRTAAAFHDSGFMFSPEEHEERSAKIAAEYLPRYGFNETQIEQIQKMIRATKIPQQPTDLPSKVLSDADLYYLGTDSFYETGEKLYEEFKIQGIVNNRKDWYALQIRFLESHQYHTQTVRKACEAQKQKHLEELRGMMEE